MTAATLPAGGGILAAQAATFDGSDYASAASLTGQADSKQLTVSVWLYIPSAAAGGAQGVLTMVNSGIASYLYFDTTNSRFSGRFLNASGGAALEFYLTDPLADDRWHHVMFSVDLSDSGKQAWLLDGVLLTGGSSADLTPGRVAIQQYVDIEMDFTPSSGWETGGVNGGSNSMDGSLAELYFAPGGYIDLSSPLNQRKFLIGDYPASLGAAGQLPTGSVPLIYLSGDGATFANNKGGGGSFTLTGTLDDYAGKVKLP